MKNGREAIEFRMKNMGMFAGISEVEVRQKNRYVEPGNYIVEITAVKSGRAQQSEKPYFVVEFEVEESDNPEFDPGAAICWMKMVHQYKKYFLEDVKGFVATALGVSAEEVTEEVCEYVSGEDQPLIGKRLSLRAYLETNQKSGKSFCESEFRLLD
jgi:hypothetical protein